MVITGGHREDISSKRYRSIKSLNVATFHKTLTTRSFNLSSRSLDSNGLSVRVFHDRLSLSITNHHIATITNAWTLDAAILMIIAKTYRKRSYISKTYPTVIYKYKEVLKRRW